MRTATILLIVFWVLFPVSIYADIYRYTDQNGVLRFTDNLADVPENQQSGLKTYPESADTTKQPERTQNKLEHRTNRGARMDTDKRDRTKINRGQNLPLSEKLIKNKAELDKESVELKKELEVFSKERESLFDQQGSSGYKEEVKDFNERLADFEQRRKSFQKKQDEYNAETNR